jgi:hypothetical protein
VKVTTRWLTQNDGTHTYIWYQHRLIPLSILQHGPAGVILPFSAERKQGTPTHKLPNMSYFRSMSGHFDTIIYSGRNAPLRDPRDMPFFVIFRAMPSITVLRNGPPVPMSWVSPFKTCWSSNFHSIDCHKIVHFCHNDTQLCSIDMGLA